ncbi:MAG: DUF4168 domain-containing protein [Bacteroidota bacterium]
MPLRKQLTAFLSLFAFLLIAVSPALAQQQQMPQPVDPDEISDQELQTFVNTSNDIRQLQQESNQKVKKKVEAEGMAFDRFQKIMMSKQNPQQAGEVEVSSEEEKTIENLQSDLMQIQQQTRQGMMEKIQDSDLSMQRFQQIAMTIRQNPDLMQRAQKLTQDS